MNFQFKTRLNTCMYLSFKVHFINFIAIYPYVYLAIHLTDKEKRHKVISWPKSQIIKVELGQFALRATF